MNELDDIYGAPPPSKRGHWTSTDDLLTEDDVRKTMSDLTRGYEGERERIRKAHQAFNKREAQVQLAITFLEPDLLYNKQAKDYLIAAKEKKTKLTVADKEALIMMELEKEKVEYDLAKFDCDTSDSLFKKLEPQLSFYQSLLKLR